MGFVLFAFIYFRKALNLSINICQFKISHFFFEQQVSQGTKLVKESPCALCSDFYNWQMCTLLHQQMKLFDKDMHHILIFQLTVFRFKV